MAATCMESKKDKDILACVCVRHVLNGIVLHPQLQPELHLQKHLMNSFWTFRLVCLFLTETKSTIITASKFGRAEPFYFNKKFTQISNLKFVDNLELTATFSVGWKDFTGLFRFA